MKKIIITCYDLHPGKNCTEECIGNMESIHFALWLNDECEIAFSWYGEPIRLKVSEQNAILIKNSFQASHDYVD